MHNMKTASVLLFSILATSAYASDHDLLWKARGLKAQERLQKLNEKNGDSKGKKLTKKELCEYRLEAAYAAFANSELSKVVHKEENGIEVFKIVLVDHSKPSGRQMSQLNYSYDVKSGKLTAVANFQLADDWFLVLIPGFPGHVSLKGGGCSYIFDQEQPLKALFGEE